MPDDFSDAPESLAMLRSEREADASICPPRDALVSLLKEIDKGLDVNLCIIAYRVGPNGCARYLNAGGAGLHDSLGLLTRVQHNMSRAADA